MRSRFKILGHPAHPVLVAFPLALFPAAGIADIAWLIFGQAFLWHMAFWLLVGGLLGYGAAALPGLIDWLNIPSDAPSKQPATFHFIIAQIIGFLTIISLLLRDPWNQLAPGALNLPHDLPFVVAIGVNLFNAFVLLMVQGWLGAELVYKHGIGVESSDGIDPITPAPGSERMRKNV